jgi:hypothetical protein
MSYYRSQLENALGRAGVCVVLYYSVTAKPFCHLYYVFYTLLRVSHEVLARAPVQHATILGKHRR